MADTQTPTVNSQITDAVTQTNVTVVGEAPAQSMAMVYQSMAHSTSLLMQNSVMAQAGMQQINSAVVASACQRIMTLPSQKVAAPLQLSLNPAQTKPDELKSTQQKDNLEPRTPERETISEDKKRSIILKVAQEVTKVADLASEASDSYRDAQESAKDHSNRPEVNAEVLEASRYSTMASQAAQKAEVLYNKIFNATNSKIPDIDTIKNLYKQLRNQVVRAETARDKVREYKAQLESIADLDA